MIESVYLWLVGAYIVGTAFGWWAGRRKKVEDIVAVLIDELVEQGFIKTRKTDKENEVELIKHWED